MSRNSSGTYTLPAGNPVVTGTTITSTWGNTTMSDIANALTDSLSRSGQGSMQVGLRLFDGTSALPGLTWGTELTSGMYRAGAGDFRWVITTTELLQLTANLLQISGTAPVLRLNESDAAVNNRLWDVIASGEALSFRVLTDALVSETWMAVERTAGVVDSITVTATFISTQPRDVTGAWSALFSNTAPQIGFNETDAAANNRLWLIGPSGEQFIMAILDDAESVATQFMAVNRTGTTVDTVNFPSGTLQYGGAEVGLKDLARTDFSNNVTATNAMRGTFRRYTGTGGHSFDVPGSVIAAGGLITLANDGTGSFTITASAGATLQWLNGSGTVVSGTRTIAVGGVVTLYMVATTVPTIWGVGIS